MQERPQIASRARVPSSGLSSEGRRVGRVAISSTGSATTMAVRRRLAPSPARRWLRKLVIVRSRSERA